MSHNRWWVSELLVVVCEKAWLDQKGKYDAAVVCLVAERKEEG